MKLLIQIRQEDWEFVSWKLWLRDHHRPLLLLLHVSATHQTLPLVPSAFPCQLYDVTEDPNDASEPFSCLNPSLVCCPLLANCFSSLFSPCSLHVLLEHTVFWPYSWLHRSAVIRWYRLYISPPQTTNWMLQWPQPLKILGVTMRRFLSAWICCHRNMQTSDGLAP